MSTLNRIGWHRGNPPEDGDYFVSSNGKIWMASWRSSGEGWSEFPVAAWHYVNRPEPFTGTYADDIEPNLGPPPIAGGAKEGDVRWVVQNDTTSMYRTITGWVADLQSAWTMTEPEAVRVSQDGSLNYVHAVHYLNSRWQLTQSAEGKVERPKFVFEVGDVVTRSRRSNFYLYRNGKGHLFQSSEEVGRVMAGGYGCVQRYDGETEQNRGEISAHLDSLGFDAVFPDEPAPAPESVGPNNGESVEMKVCNHDNRIAVLEQHLKLAVGRIEKLEKGRV